MSGARPDTWMPLYWGDYLRDTMHLSTIEHGAYLLLIGSYWTRGGPLPDDDSQLAAIARQDMKGWLKIRPVLAALFESSAGQWRHKRIEEELQRARTGYQKRCDRTAAARAARAVTGNVTTPVTASVTEPATKDVTTPVTGTQPQPQPQPQPQSPTEKGNARTVAGAVTPMRLDWQPGPESEQFCALRAIQKTTQDQQLDPFRLHYVGNGEMRANWDAVWCKWLISQGRFEQPKAAGNGGAQPPARKKIDPAEADKHIWDDLERQRRTGA